VTALTYSLSTIEDPPRFASSAPSARSACDRASGAARSGRAKDRQLRITKAGDTGSAPSPGRQQRPSTSWGVRPDCDLRRCGGEKLAEREGDERKEKSDGPSRFLARKARRSCSTASGVRTDYRPHYDRPTAQGLRRPADELEETGKSKTHECAEHEKGKLSGSGRPDRGGGWCTIGEEKGERQAGGKEMRQPEETTGNPPKCNGIKEGTGPSE